MQNLETKINNLWDQRENTDFNDIKIKENIDEVASLIDSGALRVCDRINDEWHVNQWVKKAILLSFRTNKMAVIDGGPFINGHA